MEQLILKKYREGKHSPIIAKELGVTSKYVRKVLNGVGIISKYNNKGNAKHEKNTNFFTVPNLKNSYWAGFIAADGHLSQDSGVIISLASKDEEHLNAFKNDINYSGEIRKYTTSGSFSADNGSNYSRISVYSKKLCDDLIKNWNVTHNKTHNIKFPSHLSKDILFSYCIGYIDGDGSFNKSKGKLHSLNICGHKKFLEDMRNFLCDYFDENERAIKIYVDHTIYRLTISRKNLLNKVRDTVLTKFTEIHYMDRKWSRLFEADLSGGRI